MPKKNMFQSGGENNQTENLENPLVAQISEALDGGGDPRSIVIALIQQNVPIEIISSTFEQFGYDPSAIASLLQEAQTIVMAPQRMQSPEGPQEIEQVQNMQNGVEDEMLPEAQYGYTGNPFYGDNVSQNYLYRNLNKDLPKPKYLPIMPERGDVFGALGVLADATDTLFGKKDLNKDGVADGTFRDWKAKKARWENTRPDQYRYDVKFDPRDPNKYAINNQDLYSGKLRTEDVYKEDILKNSRVDFNVNTGKYDGYTTDREIDRNLLGEKQARELDDFNTKSISIKDLKSRMDPEILKLILENENAPSGTTIGVSPDGNISSYRDAKTNPYYYETMMGLDPKQLPPTTTFQSRVANPFTMSPLPIKQDGSEISEPPSFGEWIAQNGKGDNQMMDQMEYEEYLTQWGIDNQTSISNPQIKRNTFVPDYEQMADYVPQSNPYSNPGDVTPVPMLLSPSGSNQNYNRLPNSYEPITLQTKKDLGNAVDYSGNLSAPVKINESNYNAPDINKKLNFGTWANRQLDRPGVKAFGDISGGIVAGAGLVNEMFKERDFEKYQKELQDFTMADNIYATKLNPLNKRGMWDVNSGLAEPDNLVPHLYRGQYGGEDDQFDELDVDMDTLTKLISAGADIQIL